MHAAVERLVMEHGEYVPLELLLATNRLAYEDYRAWRDGRLATLDAVLADGARETRVLLEGAQSWAEELGLTPEPAALHGWGENAGAALVASADAHGRGRRVELSAAHRRVSAHRVHDVLLQRGGGRDPRRRCRRAEAAYAVVQGLRGAEPARHRVAHAHSEPTWRRTKYPIRNAVAVHGSSPLTVTVMRRDHRAHLRTMRRRLLHTIRATGRHMHRSLG